jgi:hypothetical protein
MTCETALEQAGMTVSGYFQTAISFIDEKFGEGYAKKHPELLGQCVIAQSHDFASAANSDALYEIAKAIEGVGDLTQATCERLADIADAIEAVGRAVTDADCSISVMGATDAIKSVAESIYQVGS